MSPRPAGPSENVTTIDGARPARYENKGHAALTAPPRARPAALRAAPPVSANGRQAARCILTNLIPDCGEVAGEVFPPPLTRPTAVVFAYSALFSVARQLCPTARGRGRRGRHRSADDCVAMP